MVRPLVQTLFTNSFLPRRHSSNCMNKFSCLFPPNGWQKKQTLLGASMNHRNAATLRVGCSRVRRQHLIY